MVTFAPITIVVPGTIERLLTASYTDLLESDNRYWAAEQEQWRQFDRDAFNNPETVGNCVFFSLLNDELTGFGSYDPRPRPAYGVVGHNCILPEYRGRGFGRQQILEILRRFREMGIKQAIVSTGEQPYFLPAQRMYQACGFQERRRLEGGPDPRYRLIEYELNL